MRKILFLFIVCIAMVSCRSLRETTKTDISVEHGISFDSIYESSVGLIQETVTEIQRNVYDSEITHVTIFRYDTILVEGSHVLKEKVEIEQLRISGDLSTEQIRDSIKATEVEKADITYNDTITIQKHEQRQKKQVKDSHLVTLLLLMLVVCLAYIVIEKIKKT